MRNQYRHHIRLALAALMLLLTNSAPEAKAQARSFSELRLYSKPGDTIYIKTNDGSQSKVRVVGLTDTSLKVEANGVIRNRAQENAADLHQRRQGRISSRIPRCADSDKKSERRAGRLQVLEPRANE